MRVKLFYGNWLADLEHEINSWIESNETSIKVCGISAGSNEDGCVIAVSYIDLSKCDI